MPWMDGMGCASNGARALAPCVNRFGLDIELDDEGLLLDRKADVRGRGRFAGGIGEP